MLVTLDFYKLPVKAQAEIAKYVDNTEVIRVLMQNQNREVRVGIASNVNASEEILDKIVREGDRYEIKEALQNPSLSKKTMQEYGCHGTWAQREYIAMNPAITEELITKLMYDENLKVVYALLENPILTSKDIQHIFERFQEMIYHGPFKKGQESLSYQALEMENMRDTKAPSLDFLQGMRNCLIRMASNPTTSQELLKELYELGYETASFNPNAPESIRKDYRKLTRRLRSCEKKNLNKFSSK